MRKNTIICIALTLLVSSLTLGGQEKPKDGAGDPEPVYLAAAEATASSFMVESDARYFRYHPWRAFDDDPLTAWNEGEKGPGIGESLVLDLAEPILVDTVEILPGYFDPRWFAANNRIKYFDLYFFDPAREKRTVFCADEMEPAVIGFRSPVKFKQMVLQIGEVYPGEKYDDTGVSEIRFFYQSRRIEVDGEIVRQKMKEMEGKALVADPAGLYCFYNAMYEDSKYYFFEDGLFARVSQQMGDGRLLIQKGKWRRKPGAGQLDATVELSITVTGSGDFQDHAPGFRFYQVNTIVRKNVSEQLKLPWVEWVSLNHQPLGSAEYEIRIITPYHYETIKDQYDTIASQYKSDMEKAYAYFKKNREAGELF